MEIQKLEALQLRRPEVRLQFLLVEPDLVFPGTFHKVISIRQHAVGSGVPTKYLIISRLQIALELIYDRIIRISADLPQLMTDHRLAGPLQGGTVITAPPSLGIPYGSSHVGAVAGTVEIDKIHALNLLRRHVIEPSGLGRIEPPALIAQRLVVGRRLLHPPS